MSGINWGFVTQNMLLSFLGVFFLLISLSICISVYYFILLNQRLNKIRKKLVHTERAMMAKNRQKPPKKSGLQYPDITAYIDTSEQRPKSPLIPLLTKASNDSTVTLTGSREYVIPDNSEKVAKTEPTVPTEAPNSGQSESPDQNNP